MMQLDISCVNRWVVGNKQVQYPASIGISCPECSMRGAFTTKRRTYDEYRDTLTCSADCPACSTQVHFWITDVISNGRDDIEGSTNLYMMPSSKVSLNLTDLPDNVPPNVIEYCSSTVDVYASGNLTATTVLAHSALEAIFEEYLPRGNSKPSLSKLIQDSTEAIGLNKPLEDLANALRPEGNLHNLLSSSQFTSKESADAMMLLLDRLIHYLYILPNDLAALDKQFAELNRTTNLARKDLNDSANKRDAA